MKKSDLQSILDQYDAGKGWTRGFLRNDSGPMQALRALLERQDIKLLPNKERLSPKVLAEIDTIIGADADKSRDPKSLTATLLWQLSIQVDAAQRSLESSLSNPTHYQPEVDDVQATQYMLGKPNVSVADYILNVYDVVLEVNGALQAKRSLDDILLLPSPSSKITPPNKLSDNYHYICYTLPIKAGWQPLPGISANDTLVTLKFADRDKGSLQLGYCNKTNQYMMRYTNPQEIQLCAKLIYNLRSPVPASRIGYVMQEQELTYHFAQLSAGNLFNLRAHARDLQIDVLIRFFESFTNKPLNIAISASEADKWAARLQQRCGDCRHRAMLMMQMAQKLNIPTRLVTNAVHAFVQVGTEDGWLNIDLGGKPAKYQITKGPEITLHESLLRLAEGDARQVSEPLRTQYFGSDALHRLPRFNQALPQLDAQAQEQAATSSKPVVATFQ